MNQKNPDPATEKTKWQRKYDAAHKANPVEDFQSATPVNVSDLANQPMTPEELSITRRIMSEKETFLDYGKDDVVDYSLMRDQFAIPEPALNKEKARELKFRWITRSPERLDQMRNKPVPFRWWIANRTTAPFLEGFFDPVLGCISREDQMLVMKPWWMFEKEVNFKRGIADAKSVEGDIRSLDGQVRSGVEFRAGVRTEEQPSLGAVEVRGGDIIMADEGMMDIAAGDG